MESLMTFDFNSLVIFFGRIKIKKEIFCWIADRNFNKVDISPEFAKFFNIGKAIFKYSFLNDGITISLRHQDCPIWLPICHKTGMRLGLNPRRFKWALIIKFELIFIQHIDSDAYLFHFLNKYSDIFR